MASQSLGPAVKASGEGRNLHLRPSLQPESPGQGTGGGNSLLERNALSIKNPAYEATAEPGPMVAGSRPSHSPLQLAANGWWAVSFFAVTSEAFGSPLTARRARQPPSFADDVCKMVLCSVVRSQPPACAVGIFNARCFPALHRAGFRLHHCRLARPCLALRRGSPSRLRLRLPPLAPAVPTNMCP